MLLVRIFALLGLLVTASACSIPDAARSGLRPLDDKNALIRFTAGPFAVPARERLMYADPSQREEYARIQSADAVAEVVYLTTRDYHMNNLSLVRWGTLEKMVNSWNYTKNRNVIIEDGFQIDPGWVGMWVKPFSLSSPQQNCAGFNAEWDRPSEDPDQNPSKALFGYFCANPGAPLTRAEMQQRLSEVAVRGISSKLAEQVTMVPAVPDHPSQRQLQARSRELPYGTPDFPYIAARPYSIHDGCSGAVPCP